MYSETIENYSRKIWVEAHDAEQKIKEELKLSELKDDETLKQCLNLAEKLRETMCSCSSFMESFIDRKQDGTVDQTTVEWAEKTVKDLCQFEYALLNMYASYNPKKDATGEIIPIDVASAPGTITVDIGIAMPHKKNAGLKSSSALSYLLDESFRTQLEEVGDEARFECAYIFIEHHVNQKVQELRERDCDNYDCKHLIDLAAEYFLKYGDGPEYVRIGEAVVKDDHTFTRMRLVDPNFIVEYAVAGEGFFQWDKGVTNREPLM